MRGRTWSSLFLAVAALLTAACATAPPKTTTVDQLAGTTWTGEWGSDGQHGMRNPVRFKIDQADLGAIKGTVTITSRGRDHAFPASGLLETKDGATWLRVTVEGNRTFDLRFTGGALEGRGKSAIHEGPVSLKLE
ncbi:MAG: hypothetical protein ACRD1X_03225 [Vicinamibacteria bacterium]